MTLQRWQIAVVAGLLVVAWVIDVQLFAILAAVATAGVVFAEVHGRSRATRNATAPLSAATRAALGLGADAPLATRVGGRPVSLTIEAHPGRDGTLRGCLQARMPAGRGVPFCFVGQQREAPVGLPSLVANAALFQTRLECELELVTVDAAPPLDGYAWASSSPGALVRLLDASIRERLATIASWEGVALAALHFDGAAVQVLLVPTDPHEGVWIRPLVTALGELARAVDEGLDRVAAE